MNQTAITEEMLVRYLLGRMGDVERDRLDEQHFGDRDFVEQLVVVENELIDSYVRGELSAEDCREFEALFLTHPERRRRVDFARNLLGAVSNARAQTKRVVTPVRVSWIEKWRLNSPWVIVPIAATLLLAVTSLWLGSRIMRLNTELEEARATLTSTEAREKEMEDRLADERELSDRLADQLAAAEQGPATREAEAARAPAMVAFVLRPGLSRSSGTGRTLVIPAQARTVRLTLSFDDDEGYSGYVATIETVEGRTVWTGPGLRARKMGDGRIVVLDVPAATLDRQDYVLALSGRLATGETETVAEYFFRVVKE